MSYTIMLLCEADERDFLKAEKSSGCWHFRVLAASFMRVTLRGFWYTCQTKGDKKTEFRGLVRIEYL